MSDRDLERLQRTATPAPSRGARERALLASLKAYDAAQAGMSESIKGSAEKPRLNPTGPVGGLNPWRGFMHSRLAMGGAAACLLAVPLTAALYSQHGLPGLGANVGGGATAPLTTKAPETAREDVEPRTAEQDALALTEPEAKSETRAESAPAPEPEARAYLAPAPESPLEAAPMPRDAAPARGRIGGVPAPSFMPRPDDRVIAPQDRDRFVGKDQNGVKVAAADPVSTFSIDADTASYSWIRRSLLAGRMPAPDSVRVEELINYFPYDYPAPESPATPFRPTVSVMPAPWSRDTKIVQIGIRGFDAAQVVRPKANLVFLVDVSGSMNARDKLPLVKASLKLLLDRLEPDDSVALVTYAGAAGVALQPTKASDREAIRSAIDGLGAGGSTAGAAGIEEAYRLARKNFDPKGVNRVMIATDGDFNVGTSDDDGLQRLIESERKSGVFLSVLGFGQGNYNDALMQRLAQNGNGTAAYIDQLEEAQKVLVEEAGSALFPIAKDVKIQVEFNPSQVSEYRLIGYETRMLAREDFRNDRVDAGEVGSGATVTALYEIVPAGSPARLTDDLRYGAPQTPAVSSAGTGSSEYAFLKMRYKLPNEDVSREISQPIGKSDEVASVAAASEDARFAAAVAAFGQKLKGGKYVSSMSWDDIGALANGAKGEDRWGYRAGFVRLVALARSLAPQ